MSRCIDFPCCGHELGCCPDYSEDGEQLNMVCTCGAKLPVDNRYSICDGCMRREDGDFDENDSWDSGEDEGFPGDDWYHSDEDTF